MSEPRVFFGVALVVTGAISGVAGSLISAEMQGQVNKRLPSENQLETPWSFAKQLQLLREHRSFFPDSKLRILQISLGVFMFSCFLTLAFVIGIF